MQTPTITTLNDGTTRILLDFTDEGVDLQVTELVPGDAAEAQKRVPFLESDARRNHQAMFPVPEPEFTEEEMI